LAPPLQPSLAWKDQDSLEGLELGREESTKFANRVRANSSE
jgi:hypothetical protein